MSEIAGLTMGLVAAIYYASNGRDWSEVLGHPLFIASSELYWLFFLQILKKKYRHF